MTGGNRAAVLLLLLAACAHGPTVKDALVVSVEAWAALDTQVTAGVERKAAAIALWREQARCGQPGELQHDCQRATATGRDLADFVARWDAISLVVDVVLVLWQGKDPKAAILDVAPEAVDRALASVRGREVEALREALVEARRIAKEVW